MSNCDECGQAPPFHFLDCSLWRDPDKTEECGECGFGCGAHSASCRSVPPGDMMCRGCDRALPPHNGMDTCGTCYRREEDLKAWKKRKKEHEAWVVKEAKRVRARGAKFVTSRGQPTLTSRQRILEILERYPPPPPLPKPKRPRDDDES